MELTTVWFILIAVLWIGYFALEGFDFGVGMLLSKLGRNDTERRVVINTIGPVWDGNEVWLLVAIGATFAAFPNWYAALLSGMYLPVLVIVLGLIVRGLAFEYRHQRDDERWKSGWDNALIIGSWIPTILWGVVFANLVHGVPIDANQTYAGTLLDLFEPVDLLGAVMFVGLFLTHGAMYLALKTEGEIRDRAGRIAWQYGLLTLIPMSAFLIWTQLETGNLASAIAFLIAVFGMAAGALAAKARREGWAFVGTFGSIAVVVTGFFLALFPDVMPSSSDAANSLTTSNASATPYTLTVMTWVAAIFTPLVLAYQAWSYWVFRRRIGTRHIPTAELADRR